MFRFSFKPNAFIFIMGSLSVQQREEKVEE